MKTKLSFLATNIVVASLFSPATFADSANTAALKNHLLSASPIESLPGELHPDYGKLREACVPTAGKIPEWADGEMVSAPWYQHWLNTTVSLCINLKNIEKDQAMPFEKIHWREDSDILFRSTGSTLTSIPSIPDVFLKGFFPWQPDGGNLAMVSGIATQESGIVSTSYNIMHTRFFGVNTYIIDAPGGVDVDNSFGVNEQEIAFPGGIQPDYIHGVIASSEKDWWGKSWTGIDYYLNPHYRNFSPNQSGQIDLILSSTGRAMFGRGINRMTGENNIHFLLDGKEINSRITRLPEKQSMTLAAVDAEQQYVPISYWYISGLGAVTANENENRSCIKLPGGMNYHNTIIVQAVQHSKPRPDAGDKPCLLANSSELVALKDKSFTDTGNLKDYALRYLNEGSQGGWQVEGGAFIFSAKGAHTESASQAVELSRAEYEGKNYYLYPGKISQKVSFIKPDTDRSAHLKSVLLFRLGNNTQPWCAKPADSQWQGSLPFLQGSQDVEVTVRLEGQELPVAQKRYNLGTSPEFVIDHEGKRKHARMNPQWHSYALALDLPEPHEDLHLTIEFASKSKALEACGALVSDVDLISTYGIDRDWNK
ncbi:scabin-related ADP-ribosyltransferase [Pantoea cypripedii]|uniref:Pierisin-like domain-containing protein n=1 Tax=Pantoea cypripedii TaxID=55209 RepID=A0A1X1ER76_PANCY|nr:hypothetical protein [Pantoea cypripedii]MBP2196508.1 hypothetical protein [Pantoea cypripedii]ORM92492.1 hypothetical protein HA50_03625 [Pantoea cypripedii]